MSKKVNRSIRVAGEGTIVNGPVVTGGKNVFGPVTSPPQPYTRKSVRLLPVTERVLGVASAIVTVGVFTSGYGSVRQLLGGLHAAEPKATAAGAGTAASSTTPIWTFVFMGFMVVAAVLVFVWTAMRRSTQHLSRFSFLPGLAGARDASGRHRLALVKNEGRCTYPGCNGKLRFYAKATAWEPYVVNRQTKRRVVERTPVAECKRYPKRHCYEIDITDTSDLN